MIEIEQLIRFLAILSGIIVLIAPLRLLLWQSRRPKGRTTGKAASTRKWFGVLLITIVLVAIGFLLWKPIPLPVSDSILLLITLVGAVFYFPGIGLYLWGLSVLRTQFGVSGLLGAELYQGHQLIKNGPFARIRHPMYAGVLLAAVGALLIFRTWAMLLFMPMSLVVIGRAEREEKLLAAEFGEQWESYASKVPKWFPKVK
jgi:protein-S-isoprenylcysteine O-methyltransferase Ste14